MTYFYEEKAVGIVVTYFYQENAIGITETIIVITNRTIGCFTVLDCLTVLNTYIILLLVTSHKLTVAQ